MKGVEVFPRVTSNDNRHVTSMASVKVIVKVSRSLHVKLKISGKPGLCVCILGAYFTPSPRRHPFSPHPPGWGGGGWGVHRFAVWQERGVMTQGLSGPCGWCGNGQRGQNADQASTLPSGLRTKGRGLVREGWRGWGWGAQGGGGGGGGGGGVQPGQWWWGWLYERSVMDAGWDPSGQCGQWNASSLTGSDAMIDLVKHC